MTDSKREDELLTEKKDKLSNTKNDREPLNIDLQKSSFEQKRNENISKKDKKKKKR